MIKTKSKSKVKSGGTKKKNKTVPMSSIPFYNLGGWHNISGGESEDNVAANGIRVTNELALKVAAVYACCNVISETIACLPIGVYARLKKGGKEKLKDHYLYELLHYEPNSWQSPVEFVENLVLWICLRGNGYDEIVLKSGLPKSLLPIRADRVTPEWVSDGKPRYKISMPDGKIRIIPQERMCHVRNKSLDGLNGLSPIALGAETIGMAIAVRKYGSKAFTSSGTKRIALEHPLRLQKEAYERLRQSWEENYGGANNQGKAAVLEEGLKANVIGMSLEDAQRIEAEQFSVEDICRFYRMPPHKIQHLLHATYSNIEEQSIEFGSDTILPWCRRIEAAWNRDLIYEKDQFVEFNLNGLMRGKASERAAYYSTMFAVGAYSTNDILALENENDIGSIGDKRYISTNLQELGAKTAQVQNVKPVKQEQTEDSQEPEQEEDDSEETMKMLSVFIENAAERLANAWSRERAKQNNGEITKNFTDKQTEFALKTIEPIWQTWQLLGKKTATLVIKIENRGDKTAWIQAIKESLI